VEEAIFGYAFAGGFYIFVYKWEKYTINIQEKTYGEGDNVLELKSDIAGITTKSSEAIYPTVEMQGVSYFHEEKGGVPLMLAFAENNNIWNNSSGGPDRIYLNPESLFSYCWKNTAEMFTNSYQPYECTLRLPLNMLDQFDYSKIYKIKSSLFFCEELNYNLEAETISYEKSKLRAI
jgi:hypothetical protein